MDYDHEIASLAAETIALQTILSSVLYRIGQTDPALREAIRAGFDDAANQIEALAISAGKASRPDHLVKALGIVEELRWISAGGRDRPKRSV